MPFHTKSGLSRPTCLGLDAAEWRGFAFTLLGVLGMALAVTTLAVTTLAARLG